MNSAVWVVGGSIGEDCSGVLLGVRSRSGPERRFWWGQVVSVQKEN